MTTWRMWEDRGGSKWIDPSEWWWRKERLTSRESLWLPGGIQSGLTNDWVQWVWCFLSVRHPGLIPVYQKNSCTLLFSGLRSPYAAGILSTLFSVWMKCVLCMDECAARLQPLADPKLRQTQTFAIEKIPRFNRNNPIMSWGQKHLFLT